MLSASTVVSGPTFEAWNKAQAVTRLEQIASTLGGYCETTEAGTYQLFVPGLVILTADANAWLCRVGTAGRIVGCEAAAWWEAHVDHSTRG